MSTRRCCTRPLIFMLTYAIPITSRIKDKKIKEAKLKVFTTLGSHYTQVGSKAFGAERKALLAKATAIFNKADQLQMFVLLLLFSILKPIVFLFFPSFSFFLLLLSLTRQASCRCFVTYAMCSLLFVIVYVYCLCLLISLHLFLLAHTTQIHVQRQPCRPRLPVPCRRRPW